MDSREVKSIIAGILIVFLVASFSLAIEGGWKMLPSVLVFSVLVILVSVFSRKFVANSLDADVEHRMISFSRWGLKTHQKLAFSIPAGIILPLFFSLFSLGYIKFMGILSYEARALKRRAAKRFGIFSYSELTEWHNGLIGAGGILGVLLLSTAAYAFGLEYLARISAFYAFSNIIPIGNMDGTQIFFGSRILWTALAITSLVFFVYALFLI